MEQQIRREQIVNEARSWLGTPWHHQARKKGVGCDCIGLVVGVLNAVTGNAYPDITNYGHQPDRKFALKKLREHLTQIPKNEAEPGDIILLSMDEVHLGILTDRGVIHSYACEPRRVIEHGLTPDLEEKISAVFRV